MKAVKKLAVLLSLGALVSTAALAASTEAAYLAAYRTGPGVPRLKSVVAPVAPDARPGASAQIAFIVDEQGVPREISVASTTDTGLGEAAVEAVKQWRFEPVVRDGKAVATKVVLPVRAVDRNATPGLYAAR